MATMSLNAANRTEMGKGAARKLRRTGSVPGVVYREGNEALSVAFNLTEFDTVFRITKDSNTLIKLGVDGEDRLCLVKAVQRHPVSKVIRHVDFYEVLADETITVSVRLNAVGTAEGIKLGGSLRYVRRSLTIACAPKDIPSTIDVDVSHLHVGDVIQVKELATNKKYKILTDDDITILALLGKRGIEEAEEEGDEGSEEGTETEAAEEGEA